jgi:hypothetical protein
MGKRPRIERAASVGEAAVEDPLKFSANKGSVNARQVGSSNTSISIELWLDKHVTIRQQHGDDNGKREGINQDVVNSLVANAMKHLLFYGSKVAGFSFLNRKESVEDRAIRVVLQDSINDAEEKLNVVIEAHFVNFDKYEITVITAMRKNEFRISNGQFMVEFVGENSSVLKKNTNMGIQDICSCED